MTPKSHEEIQELLGAFALDAVDQSEADIIEAHLPDCPRCREEVESFRETAAALAHVGAAAPDGLWNRIVDHLETPVPGPELARIMSFPTAVSHRRRLALGAAAAVIVLIVGLLSAEVVRQHSRVGRLAASVRSTGIEREIIAAAADPAARHVHLVSADKGHTADVLVRPNGQAYLIQHDLPALAADETYQLWGVAGTTKVSLALLGGRPAQVAFRVEGEMSALAVTAEKKPGVAASTHPAVVSGSVPAPTA